MFITIVSYIIAVIVSIAAGFIGTILGIGGGSVMVPLLVAVGYDIKVAAPASLVAILGTSMGGLRYLFTKRLVDYRLAGLLETASISGAIVGVMVFGRLTSIELTILLAITLIILGVYFIIRSKRGVGGATRTATRYYSVARLGIALLASFTAGILSAMLGIGGGVIKVPILVVVIGLPIHMAVSTSKLMVGITALTGVIGHSMHGSIDWVLGLLLLAGTYIGASVSARVLVRLRPQTIYLIAATYYLMLGTYLAIKAI